jgi:hypothetical protein
MRARSRVIIIILILLLLLLLLLLLTIIMIIMIIIIILIIIIIMGRDADVAWETALTNVLALAWVAVHVLHVRAGSARRGPVR